MAIITIGGNIGAGKTTVAARLAKALGYEEWYAGNVFREMARERGISIERFYADLANHPALERDVDRQAAQLMRKKNNLVVQGRIAWYFAKESPFPTFNIFLKVDPRVGAERTGKRKENSGRTTDKLMTINAERDRTERERYKKLYDIENFSDPKHYDFILDTTNLNEDEAFKKIMEEIEENRDSN